MRKEYQYKLQGNGRDSWTVSEYNDNDELINRYMVYDVDPTKEINPAVESVVNATPEEIEQIRRILGIS